MEIDDTLTFLLGSWTLSRSIDDHRAGTHGTFLGRAALGLEPPPAGEARLCADYLETGEICFGSHVGRASRHLRYEELSGGAVAVYFADGGLLADLDLRSGAWSASHDCGEDRYEIVTVATSADCVDEHWIVTGPDKNYTATTRLARIIDNTDIPRSPLSHSRVVAPT